MKKSAISIILATAFLMNGCSDDKNTNHDKPASVLSKNEDIVLRAMIHESLLAWINDESNLLEELKLLTFPIKITTEDYQIEYDGNEVAADQRFKDKEIVIKGVVKSIDRGIGENYFVTFEGGENPFMTPHAQMADGYTDFLSKLQKGDKQALHCIGNGKLIGSSQVKECIPFSDWSKGLEDEFVTTVTTKDLKGSGLGSFVDLMKKATSLMKQDSACFKNPDNSDKCIDDIYNAIKLTK